MNTLVTRGLLVVLLLTSVACIGTVESSAAFLNQPEIGTPEVDVIKTYGAPDYTMTRGDTSVHVYEVKDTAYYILYGWSKDVDMVVICENGEVVEVKNVKSDETMALFQPGTWNVN